MVLMVMVLYLSTMVYCRKLRHVSRLLLLTSENTLMFALLFHHLFFTFKQWN